MKAAISRSQGFSLVELMVALVIGLVIILGAGQLFLTGFQNFRKIEGLSDRQAVLTIMSEFLMRDIRRADLSHPTCAPNGDLEFWVGDACHIYTVDESGALRLSVDGDNQPVADGVESFDFLQGGESDCDGPAGYFCIDLSLGDGIALRFHAMNRTKAVGGGGGGNGDNGDNGDSGDNGDDNGNGGGGGIDAGGGGDPSITPDPDNPGYYEDGSRIYSDNCYHHNHGFRPGRGGCEI